jgi:hypothetical protein
MLFVFQQVILGAASILVNDRKPKVQDGFPFFILNSTMRLIVGQDESEDMMQARPISKVLWQMTAAGWRRC